MNFLITLFIFLLVLFLYIHITYQYKRSEDLEIYEIDYTDNIYLQEVCNVKQPILFEFKSIDEELFEQLKKPILNVNKDLYIKEINEYYIKETPIESIILPFEGAKKLLKNDANSHYFTENNHDFIEQMNPLIIDMDKYLKPPLTIQIKYDYCRGSNNCVTPLRYHTNFRQFYLVTRGKISVKMKPFNNSKYLHPYKDYDILEFCSPINVWKPQEIYLNEMDKIKFLEFDILEGHVLYIPPYWWYSIKYTDDDTILNGFTYISLMNLLANTPDYMKYFLQKQNTQIKPIVSIHKSYEKEEKDEKNEKDEKEEKDEKNEKDEKDEKKKNNDNNIILAEKKTKTI